MRKVDPAAPPAAGDFDVAEGEEEGVPGRESLRKTAYSPSGPPRPKDRSIALCWIGSSEIEGSRRDESHSESQSDSLDKCWRQPCPSYSDSRGGGRTDLSAVGRGRRG